MKKRFHYFVVLLNGLLVMAILFGGVLPAFAQGPDDNEGMHHPLNAANHAIVDMPDQNSPEFQDFQKLVAQIQPYLAIEGDKVAFTAKDAAQVGVDQESFDVIQKFVESLNKGEFVIEIEDQDGGRIRTDFGKGSAQPDLWVRYTKRGLYFYIGTWETKLIKWGLSDAASKYIFAVVGAIVGSRLHAPGVVYLSPKTVPLAKVQNGV